MIVDRRNILTALWATVALCSAATIVVAGFASLALPTQMASAASTTGTSPLAVMMTLVVTGTLGAVAVFAVAANKLSQLHPQAISTRY